MIPYRLYTSQTNTSILELYHCPSTPSLCAKFTSGGRTSYPKFGASLRRIEKFRRIAFWLKTLNLLCLETIGTFTRIGNWDFCPWVGILLDHERSRASSRLRSWPWRGANYKRNLKTGQFPNIKYFLMNIKETKVMSAIRCGTYGVIWKDDQAIIWILTVCTRVGRKWLTFFGRRSPQKN